MKKSLLWLIVLVLSISIIGAFSVTGCKEETAEEEVAEEEEVTEEEVAATEEETVEEFEPVTIEYWNVNTGEFGGPQVEEFIENFNATNDKNITVNQVSYGGNYAQLNMSLQSSLAAGIYPGVIQVSYAALNYFAENFPQHTDLETIINEYAPQDSDFLDNKYNPLVIELARSANGRLLGLPYGFSVPLTYYNKDIFREAGLDPEDPPETWQEIYEYCVKIKEETGKYGMFIQSFPDTYCIIPIFLSNGIDSMFEPDGNGGYKTIFNDEQLAVCIGGNMLTTFAKTDSEVLACWEFEKYLLDPDQINTWVRGTGYLPSTKAAVEDPEGLKSYLDETPMMEKAIQQRDEAARPWTSWPGANGLQIDQLLVNMRDAIMSGEDV